VVKTRQSQAEKRMRRGNFTILFAYSAGLAVPLTSAKVKGNAADRQELFTRRR
jgi:hypothetical protein